MMGTNFLYPLGHVRTELKHRPVISIGHIYLVGYLEKWGQNRANEYSPILDFL